MNEHDAIEQLAALLDGEGEAADAPRSLATLVQLAETVRERSELVTPDPAFRAELRAQLVAAGTPAPSTVERLRDSWERRTSDLRVRARMAVAAMTASSMLGTAGVAAAAQEALPGELLYPVKETTERVRLALATDEVEEARLQLAFAQERLEELERGAGTMSEDEIVATLHRMDESSAAGAEVLLDGVSIGGVDVGELDAFTTAQADRLVLLLGRLPLLTKPVAEDSLELLRRISVSATGLLPALDPTGAVGEVLGDDAADCDCPEGTAPRGAVGTLLDGARDLVRRPGDGPALELLECDCVERPGGPEAREPTRTTQPDAPAPTEDDGPLADPSVDDEPGGGGGTDLTTGLDAGLTGGAGQLGDTLEDVSDGLDDAVDQLGEDLGTAVDDVGGSLDGLLFGD